MTPRPQDISRRFGIGEWYGRDFTRLTDAERKRYADVQLLPKAKRPPQPCPFQSTADKEITCNKEGGVCSLRLYEQSGDGHLSSPTGLHGALRVTCPLRFQQSGEAYRWVGETILNCATPISIGEVGFLQAVSTPLGEDSRDAEAGRIDNVLVVPDSAPLAWCALEIQAVYFSGAAMMREFRARS